MIRLCKVDSKTCGSFCVLRSMKRRRILSHPTQRASSRPIRPSRQEARRCRLELMTVETPVGFLMIGYGEIPGEDGPSIAAGNYSLWRLMIDRRYQGKGGREAVRLALEYIRSRQGLRIRPFL